MKWATGVSREVDSRIAFEAVVKSVMDEFDGVTPDLALLFFSRDHDAWLEELLAELELILPGAVVLGCGAASVIGGGLEIEGRPGLVLGAAHLPGVELSSFALSPAEIRALGSDPNRWHTRLEVTPHRDPDFILLADPFDGEIEQLLGGLEAAYPEAVLLGGLASGAEQSGECLLVGAGRSHECGVVGLAMTGNVEIHSVVAQGCRPIGQPMFVTRCAGDELIEVDGRPPLAVLGELYARTDQSERPLFEDSLFLGIQMNRDKAEIGQGDFLVRNLTGSDPDSGSIHVGVMLEERQVVQFQLRDARAAAQDLHERLDAYGPRSGSAHGALLFSCLGRGREMYGLENHDTDVFHRKVGQVPLTGFFGNGEIGPVEGRAFLHAYTSVFGIIHSRG